MGSILRKVWDAILCGESGCCRSGVGSVDVLGVELRKQIPRESSLNKKYEDNGLGWRAW